MIFSKKQTDFAKNMSAMLGGGKVNLSINATGGTSGTYKNYEIGIEELPPADSANMEANLMLASSYPAYIFYRDTIADRDSYKYIDVVVKVDNKEYTTRYTPHQLKQVDDCAGTVTSFIRAVKEVNVDSLRYYSDTSMIDSPTLFALAGKLKAKYSEWGEVREQISKGFRMGEQGKMTYIYFKFFLKRPATTQMASFYIDLASRKVIGYTL